MWVDGSPGARAALRVAAVIAQDVGARLVAVHVLDRLADAGPTAERVAANVLYDEVPDAHAKARGEVGDVAERLAAAACEEGALMIVIGARSRGRSRTFFRARCAAELSELTDVPVLVAPLQLVADPAAGATYNARRFPMSVLTVPDRTTAASGSPDADNVAPIVAAVDSSAASRSAIREAVRLGVELDVPIVFVYVRRGPAGFLGAPVYQRRLSKEMDRARRVLERALPFAASAGVTADAEILEGSPRRRIAEFARDRDARLVVVGSRKRRLGRSVSSAVVRAAGRPVVVAKGLQRLAVARADGA